MAPRMAAFLFQLAMLQACHGSVTCAADESCNVNPPAAAQHQALLQTQKRAMLQSEAPREHRRINTLQVRTGSRPAEQKADEEVEEQPQKFEEKDESEEELEEDLEVTGGGKQGPGFYENLSEEGYQAVAATCCNYQMEEFIRRIIEDLGLELCSEGGLMGIVPYYTCENGIQDYTTLRKDILDKATGDCPIGALPGSCPDLSTCPGTADPAYHRRRNCKHATSTTKTARTTTTLEGEEEEETTVTTTTVTTTPTTTTTTPTTTTTTTTVTPTTTTTTTVTTTTVTPTTTTSTTTEAPTTVTTTTTTTTGCYGETEVMDIFNSKLVHTNLGAAGPDDGALNIRYEEAGMFGGKPFDIVVEATSDYQAGNNLENGYECGIPANGCITGHFGSINVLAGTSVDLTIGFQESATQVPITLSKFLFSLHDFDNAADNKTAEIAYISGFGEDSSVGPDIVATVESDGRSKLTARKADAGSFPDNPLRLTTADKRRSAAFVFEDASSISLTLEVTCNGCEAGASRNFLFAGDTNLITCPGKTFTL